MKITDKMADALGCTADFDDGTQVMIMSHPRTCRALESRGLANEHGALTDRGKAVRKYLETHPDQRVFGAGLRTLLFANCSPHLGSRT